MGVPFNFPKYKNGQKFTFYSHFLPYLIVMYGFSAVFDIVALKKCNVSKNEHNIFKIIHFRPFPEICHEIGGCLGKLNETTMQGHIFGFLTKFCKRLGAFPLYLWKNVLTWQTLYKYQVVFSIEKMWRKKVCIRHIFFFKTLFASLYLSKIKYRNESLPLSEIQWLCLKNWVRFSLWKTTKSTVESCSWRYVVSPVMWLMCKKKVPIWLHRMLLNFIGNFSSCISFILNCYLKLHGIYYKQIIL